MTDTLDVLYQDDDLIVVNKPSGMLVHRGWARDRVVLMSVVRDVVGQYVYPIHRLDRGASGAVLMALREGMAAPLCRQFEERLVEKRYVAIVRGIPPPHGTIDHPVPRDVDSDERVEAITHYRTLGSWEYYSLVEARPMHGRLHQIRRHLKHINHPLVGDVRYGKGEHNRYFRTEFGLHRLCLHAIQLSFDHPNGAGRVDVAAPLPPELVSTLTRMGLALPT